MYFIPTTAGPQLKTRVLSIIYVLHMLFQSYQEHLITVTDITQFTAIIFSMMGIKEI